MTAEELFKKHSKLEDLVYPQRNVMNKDQFIAALTEALCCSQVEPMVSQDGIGLEEGVLDAEFSYEYSNIILRTPNGWLLWSESQLCGNTLREILKYANDGYRQHKKAAKTG